SLRRVVVERDIARGAQLHAEAARTELVLVQARTSLRKDPTAAVAWLAQSPIAGADLAAAVDVVDEALALGVARHVFRTGVEAQAIEITPDGRTLIAGTNVGDLLAYDLASGARRVLGRAD